MKCMEVEVAMVILATSKIFPLRVQHFVHLLECNPVGQSASDAYFFVMQSLGCPVTMKEEQMENNNK
jgi:hypothetical protein